MQAPGLLKKMCEKNMVMMTALEVYMDAARRRGLKKTAMMRELCHITGASPSTVWPWFAGEAKMRGAAEKLLWIWLRADEREKCKFFSDFA